MPYFVWDGVQLDGSLQHGKLRARSKTDLHYILASQDIGVITCRPYSYRSWMRPLSRATVQAFLYRLSLLMKSGVAMDDALDIAARQCGHPEMRAIALDVIHDIHEGTTLAESLQYYDYFSPITIHMIQAGQESGNLGMALHRVCQYLDKRAAFIKRIRQAAFVPMVTFVFFMLVALIILMYIVPAFSHMFLASRKAIPRSTQIILTISSLVQGMGFIALAACTAAGIVLYKRVSRWPRVQRIKSYCALRTPLVGNLIKMMNAMVFLETLSLMIDGGVDMRHAFACSVDAVNNKELHNDLVRAQQELERGKSLNAALSECAHSMFQNDVYAMIEVGEESGRLRDVLHFIVHDYSQQIHQKLNHITTMIQPALMIILGLMIAALIFAVYVPIFDLSYVIG